MTSSVAFPQLGIGPFDLNRVAFSIGDFNVYWYAIIITFGMILAILFAMKFAKRYQLSSDDLLDVVLWCIPTALIGARIYYVLFSLEDFLTDGKLDWGKVFAFRNGGLAIYGGVIVGFVVAYLVCRYKKIDVMAVFDIGAMGFLIGQCIGRWGNFVNAEAFGTPTTLPWGMSIDGGTPVHPTFLYESLWNLFGFILIYTFARTLKKHNGELFSMYIAWYGFGRFWVEGLRTDSLYLFTDHFVEEHGIYYNPRISQIVALISVILGIVLFILVRKGVFEKMYQRRLTKYREWLAAHPEKAKRLEKKKNVYVDQFLSSEPNTIISSEPGSLPQEEPVSKEKVAEQDNEIQIDSERKEEE